MGKRRRRTKRTKRKHKGCDVHEGERGGQFIMVRKKGGGTRREYI